MRCINPQCNYFRTYMINSRRLYGGRLHRRRHYCPRCETCYTTFETILYDRDTASHWFDELSEDRTYFE